MQNYALDVETYSVCISSTKLALDEHPLGGTEKIQKDE
jgi:hypothetical protein